MSTAATCTTPFWESAKCPECTNVIHWEKTNEFWSTAIPCPLARAVVCRMCGGRFEDHTEEVQKDPRYWKCNRRNWVAKFLSCCRADGTYCFTVNGVDYLLESAADEHRILKAIYAAPTAVQEYRAWQALQYLSARKIDPP